MRRRPAGDQQQHAVAVGRGRHGRTRMQDGEVRILPCRAAPAARAGGARAGPGRPAPRRPRHSSRRAAAPGEWRRAQPDVQDQQRLGTQRRRLPAVIGARHHAHPARVALDDGHFPGAQQRRRRRQPFQTLGQVHEHLQTVEPGRADRLLRMHDPLAGQGPVQVARADLVVVAHAVQALHHALAVLEQQRHRGNAGVRMRREGRTRHHEMVHQHQRRHAQGKSVWRNWRMEQASPTGWAWLATSGLRRIVKNMLPDCCVAHSLGVPHARQ